MSQEHINQNRVLALTEKFIKIPSTKENPSELANIIELASKELAGFNHEVFERNKYPSILFFNASERPEKFRILLHGHLDVVQATDEKQFSPVEKDGLLYGRGASDMKSGAAAIICVFREIAKDLPYPIGLTLTTDEEIGGFDGAGLQAEKGVRTDFVISAESSNLKIANGHKGVLIVEFEATTSGGHTASDGNDKNALQKIVNIIYKINQKYAEPTHEWKTTASVTKVGTDNLAHNSVPSKATGEVNFRWIPKDDFKKILGHLESIDPTVKVTTGAYGSAHETTMSHLDIKLLAEAIKSVTEKEAEYKKESGASDLRHWTEKGAGGVDFGPIGVGFHSDNEYLEIKSLGIYTEILVKFLKSIK